MKTIKKLVLTLLAVFTLACGVAGIVTAKTQKAYADGVLNANLNIGKDIALKLSAKIDGATSASATFTWKGNDENGVEKAENYVDTVVGENSGDGTFVFTYRGIGAQYLGKTVAVTVKYDTESETEVVYAQKNLSVKDILTAYRNSSAIALGISPAAFEKIKTLSADILNYGAAAQEYTKVDTSALVNAGLTSSDYTTVDFKNLTGEVTQTGELNFVMGVRFDCNIQPMVKFKSDKQNLTATINGKEAALEALGENQYKITYKDFNILSVNDTYKFEVLENGVRIGLATCSLAALAKKYDVKILRAAYTYGTAVSNYLEAKKTLVIEAESDYVVSKRANGMALHVETTPDGVKFIKSIAGSEYADASIIFGVNAEEVCTATLNASFKMSTYSFPLSEYVEVKVNGEQIEYKQSLSADPNTGFENVNIATITLNKGFNTIKFIVKNASYPQFPGLDKIEIAGEFALNEHVGICPVCEKDTKGNGEDKCTCKYNVIEAESDCVTLTQAAAIASNGVVKGSNEYGGYVKAENGNAGSKITFNISSDVAGKALLRVYIAPKCDDYFFHNEYAVKINGGEYSFESKKVEKDPELGENEWLARNYVCVVIGEIDLSAGNNAISFIQKGYAGTIMDKIELISTSATVTGVAQPQAQ